MGNVPPAVTHDAGIERMDPGEDFDQRGFAGAVLAQERDDFTRADFDACVTEGTRAAKPLRHAAHRQKILFRPLGKGHWKLKFYGMSPGDGRAACVSAAQLTWLTNCTDAPRYEAPSLFDWLCRLADRVRRVTSITTIAARSAVHRREDQELAGTWNLLSIQPTGQPDQPTPPGPAIHCHSPTAGFRREWTATYAAAGLRCQARRSPRDRHWRARERRARQWPSKTRTQVC